MFLGRVGYTTLFEGRSKAAATVFYSREVGGLDLAGSTPWHEAAVGPATAPCSPEPSYSLLDSYARCVFSSMMRVPMSPAGHSCRQGRRQRELTRIPVYSYGCYLVLTLPNFISLSPS